MLTLNDRWSLFALSLLCFSSSVLVNGTGDDGTKYGTESSAPSTSSRTSLADLFAKDLRKTLADLIADESGKGTEKKTTLAELIREEGIEEEEFDQLVEEMGDNERLIEKVFEDEANQNENRNNQMNSEMLAANKEKYRIIKAIKEKDTVMSQIIEELRSFKKEIKTGQFSQNALKGYLQFVIQILALRLRISTEKIVPLKKMSKKRIFIELVKLFIQVKKANKEETKMRQNVGKKGQNAKLEKGEKVADKTKANLQRMLQVLGTAINQIDDTEQLTDVGFVGKQKRRTKRCLIDLIILLLNLIDWIISLIFAIILGVVAVPVLMVAVVVNGIVKGSVAAVNSIRHLHRSDPIVPPASQNRPAIPPIQISGDVISVSELQSLAFDELPQRIVKEGEQSAECCAICLGNYEQGESVITLPCAKGKHEFHAECFKTWLKQNNSCPLCRKIISTVPVEKGSTSNAPNAMPVF